MAFTRTGLTGQPAECKDGGTDSLPTELLVCDGLMRHHEPPLGTVLTRVHATALQVQTQLGGQLPSASWDGMADVLQNHSSGHAASATRSMTVLLALATALLESISYTPGLSAGRTFAELLGAQGSGQTA